MSMDIEHMNVNETILMSIAFFCRFDVEKECAKVDGIVNKDTTPTIINHGLPKIQRKLDTSGEIEYSFSSSVVQ